MFTGIVEETGQVESAERHGDVLKVRVRAGGILKDLPLGGSIAVNGCCLTAISVRPGVFECDLTEETLRRTAFGQRLVPGARVNLERPMPANGRFDGHIVQGHVDGVGRIAAIQRTGEAAEYEFEPPAGLERYLVEKGSVALDGISLTVARLLGPRPSPLDGRTCASFTVALIPYTLQLTNLGAARAGDLVNVEVDVVAKYVERLLGPRAGTPS